MPEAAVVRFNATDIPFGKALTDLEGWHRTTADWERLFRLEPDGIFKAISGEADAGVAAVLCYGKVAWIHSVIVLPERRRQGLGRQLMTRCVEHARRVGATCIKLDGVPAARSFYTALGFAEEFPSKRFIRQGETCLRLAERMKFSDLDDVFAFDYAQTGLNRARVLRDIFRENQNLAFLQRENSKVKGFLLGREGGVRVNLGPCIVRREDEQCATDLLKSALSQTTGRTVRLCVSGANSHALAVCKRLKFEESEGSTRMYLGERFEETGANYAMISPEKG